MNEVRLAIFERLRTRPDELSAKALRQRYIIQALVDRSNPQDRTRTGLAKNLAAATGSKWQTTYPAIFADIEKILIPLGIIREEGRLALRRGPRMMQERGSPYYSLTGEGMVVALAIQDTHGLGDIIDGMDAGPHGSILKALTASSPDLVRYIMERYVEAWCQGGSSLLPLNLNKIKGDGPLAMCRGLLEAYDGMDVDNKNDVMGMLRDVGGS